MWKNLKIAPTKSIEKKLKKIIDLNLEFIITAALVVTIIKTP